MPHMRLMETRRWVLTRPGMTAPSVASIITWIIPNASSTIFPFEIMAGTVGLCRRITPTPSSYLSGLDARIRPRSH
ncbi:hypothetical protein CORC01_02946 [Colletotrichum orchidophilum]|uniref:Uncharacterized protein n=1 Tax=Colletotrichum orchidophilum TaxID=1209926 RepID=A0A1G4BK97_9PEZI|nr:uncharacterized protein CORC01_02946 [Colletotrichum orchidophilum]OHF01755.1 hypothetical protein CORC01_02946 [Colletotrichum orchidophilum]